DSVMLPLGIKSAIWEKLANAWRIDDLESLCNDIGFAELTESLDQIFKGEAAGRFVLDLNT
ncbi:MAG: oxidoreductase, partial [Gammaproteobacteria bacterium]|nr:oxidoreductase [Gammaproteobacteria bacterium]